VKNDPGATGDLDETTVTPEVGDEGGTPGDVENSRRVIGTGSEAGETWRPDEEEVQQTVRDNEE
jgi:hypothetical protein